MVERATGCDISPEVSIFNKQPAPPVSAVGAADFGLPDMKDAPPRDWSQSIPFWPVGDQGTAGSCVGWALNRGLLHWYFTRQNQLQSGELLSPNFVWLIARHAPSALSPRFPAPPIDKRPGTSFENAFRVATNIGCMKEPAAGVLWEEPPLPSGSHPSQFLTLERDKVLRLVRNKIIWADWIARFGPFVARIDMDLAFESNADKVLSTYAGRTGRGHAITVVGTEPNPKDENDLLFVIRNSWSAAWGTNGFKRATSAYLFAALTEVWGIVV